MGFGLFGRIEMCGCWLHFRVFESCSLALLLLRTACICWPSCALQGLQGYFLVLCLVVCRLRVSSVCVGCFLFWLKPF
ncbi:unnamed protein product [Trifolium pratense]|uniref:Uncharacterized protein n=1 Tax=Trifolium pratense TaxID=57577 RepID=A0ACB0JIT8_TRIPR|nr:unnamed protein product [Trifolium pratense]